MFVVKLRPKHLEFLDIYYDKNIFIASGRQNPLIGGVILARGVTRDELENLLKEDPFYTEDAATYEITEFTPNKFNSALKDLI
jgi:uncharacterized protein YciI